MARRQGRLFDLVQILRDGKLHRAADLGARLGVSTRTVWRDMAALMASGLTIEGERGIGYLLREAVALPPLALTREEFDVLRLGLALVASGMDPAAARTANGLRAKIAAVAPGSGDEAGTEGFVFSSPEAARAAPLLGLLRRALRDRLTLRLRYDDPAGGPTRRRIRPLHLEFWGQHWTLIAWCELRDDFRLFRVDRIAALEPDGGAFLPEPGRTIEDYLARFPPP